MASRPFKKFGAVIVQPLRCLNFPSDQPVISQQTFTAELYETVKEAPQVFSVSMVEGCHGGAANLSALETQGCNRTILDFNEASGDG